MALSAIYANRDVWWNIWLLEGIGFASIYAGWRLWRNDPEGLSLTRSLQWLQVIAIQGSYGVFAIASGFQVNMAFSEQDVTFSPGLWAYVNVQAGSFPFRLSFNFLAAFLLVALWGARSPIERVKQ
jgi:hypothetical protein